MDTQGHRWNDYWIAMKTTKAKVIHTGNFKNPWTWTRRTLLIMFVVIALWVFYFDDPEGFILKAAMGLLFSIVIYVFPVGDLAVDGLFLYDTQRSILPAFSKTKRYRIADISSLKFAVAYEDKTDVLMEFLGLPCANVIAEIIFSDNSSTSLRLRAYRNDVIKISRRVDAVKNAARVGDIR